MPAVARRRAAIDFFLKTEMDETVIDWYSKFKEKAASITSKPDTEPGRRDYEDIRAFLSICELIAVGVNRGVFSKRVSYAYWGDVIPNSYQTAKELIKYIRNTPGEGSRHTYVDLEKLAKRWAAEDRLTNRKTYFLVTGTLFALVALLHLVRIFADWSFIIADWSVPKWVSWVALIVVGAVAIFGFRFAVNENE
jgi:Domain of unknown function (DUF4760)